MTTLSGTADFQFTRDDLINEVLRLLHVIEEGGLANANQITSWSSALNVLIKAWHTKGIQLWTLQKFAIEPVVGDVDYLVGAGGGVVQSATVTDGGTGYTSNPTVTFSAPGGIGVTATGTAVRTGTVVTGVTITNGGTKYASKPTITFTGGGGTGAAAIANMNGRFMMRPLMLLDDAFVRQTSSNADSPMSQYSRHEYERLGNKTSQGQPHSFYYDPQLDNGVIRVYPAPNSATTYTMRFTGQLPLQDVNLANENVDFPQEWFQALKWGLANETSIAAGLPEALIDRIEKRAVQYLEEMSEWDGRQDNTSVQFAPAGSDGRADR